MTVTIIDGTHASVPNIPANAPKVAGYVSGTPDIAWTLEDWRKFNGHGKIRIEQGYGPPPSDPHGYDVLDVEQGAWNPPQVPALVRNRIANGIQWTTVYGSDGTLAAVQAALIAAEAQWGHGWYWGHVDAWLTNPLLSEQDAAAKLGTLVHGLTVRAVQWAWPRYNPDTLVPGTSLTLKAANVDLSVSQDAWFAAPVPPPPAKVIRSVTGTIVTTYTDGTANTQHWSA